MLAPHGGDGLVGVGGIAASISLAANPNSEDARHISTLRLAIGLTGCQIVDANHARRKCIDR